MNNHNENPFQPLCRFGPGGEFTSDWPAKNRQDRQPPKNQLLKVLAALNDIISTMVGAEFIPADEHKGNREHGILNTDKQAHTSAEPTAQSDSLVPIQSVLFPDNWRAGRPLKDKPKYRIRTHRRAAKKRTSFSDTCQGSLFETDLQGSKTA
jgi:hypothetical protein